MTFYYCICNGLY